MSAFARVDEPCRQIIERLPYGVVLHDERGDILFANMPAAELVGVTCGDLLVGTPITDLFVGPYLWAVREQLLRPHDDGVRARSVRRRLTRADGGSVEVDVAATPFLAGRQGEVQLVFNDVGPRARAQELEARTVAALMSLLGELSWVAWTTDTSGAVTWSSAHGGAGGQALPRGQWREGTPLAVALGLSDDPRIADVLARALRSEVATCYIRVAERAASIEMGPLRGAVDGPPVGTVGLGIDVTDRQLHELRRLEQERLDGLARFSGGVAHQFNNLLAIILARAEALRHLSTGPEASEDLDAVIAATQRGGEVAEQLLGFARIGAYRQVSIDVGGLVEIAAARATVDASGAVDVRVVAGGPDPLAVQGDPRQLATALRALTTNALDVTPSGGSVTLRAERVELTVAELRGVEADGSFALPGSFVSIEVADRGAGVSDEVRARVFEPYFTTRGEGRGLGLAMAYGVARRHGGLVRIVSEVGVGTRAQLILPLVAGAQDARAAPPVEGRSARADRGTALVVDDEALVRRALKRLVEQLGYAVVEAEGGQSALAAFGAAKAQPFAFVLLDLRMPEMSGDEVLRRLLAIDPGVRVILCTGFADDRLIRELFSLGRVGLLLKPFGRGALEAEIAAVTAG